MIEILLPLFLTLFGSGEASRALSRGVPPDLRISSFTVLPNPALPGQEITFSVVVENIGGQDLLPFWVNKPYNGGLGSGSGSPGQFYLSFWSDLPKAPTVNTVGEDDGCAFYKPQAFSFKTTWQEAGTYAAWVFVDSQPGQIKEGDEKNNCACVVYQVRDPAGHFPTLEEQRSKPDLAITSLEVLPKVAMPGDLLTVTARIENHGGNVGNNYAGIDLWADSVRAPRISSESDMSDEIPLPLPGTVSFAFRAYDEGAFKAWAAVSVLKSIDRITWYDYRLVPDGNPKDNFASVTYTVRDPDNDRRIWVMDGYRFDNKYAVYGSASTNVDSKQVSPCEMSWQGNRLGFKFKMPDAILVYDKTNKVWDKSPLGKNGFILLIDACYLEEEPKLAIYANGKLVARVVIDGYGPTEVPIPASFFRFGKPNSISLVGTNINPIGYGKSPPCVVIDELSLWEEEPYELRGKDAR